MLVCLHLDGLARTANGGAIALRQTHALLAALAEEGSVQGAARRLGQSYRSVWGRIADLERQLGRPVAVKTKGHGTALTEAGAELRAALGAVFARFAAVAAGEAETLGRTLAGLLAAEAPCLRLAMSHDPVLFAALEGMAGIELQVAGSADALDRLRAGQSDAAGFHFGSEGPAPAPFDGVLSDPEYLVRPLLVREQGLMLAPGNPLAIRSVACIHRLGARFVNRQRGAGTRLWFERLCAEANIPARAIRGYATEEFTHQAVAALIASGQADAGLGTRAAATRLGLAFAPVGWETYFLAARATLDAARLETVVAAVRAAADGVAGYRVPRHHRSGWG